jgi:DNA-binding IclR family transcriptional regulator
MGETEQAAVVRVTSFHPFTPYTIQDSAVLARELAKIKTAGFDGDGKPSAAISVAGPTVRMTNLTIETIARGLIGVTREISSRIGYFPR